jgi:hypothetical protein
MDVPFELGLYHPINGHISIEEALHGSQGIESVHPMNLYSRKVVELKNTPGGT